MFLFANAINPLYNHTHFNHIFVCVTHFLVTVHFSKKHHSLESLSHSLVAQTIYKAFFVNVTVMGGNLGQILGFCKL
jgi:presenilin-like A22 family membrane protease